MEGAPPDVTPPLNWCRAGWEEKKSLVEGGENRGIRTFLESKNHSVENRKKVLRMECHLVAGSLWKSNSRQVSGSRLCSVIRMAS